jgi:hypothetical protein
MNIQRPPWHYLQRTLLGRGVNGINKEPDDPNWILDLYPCLLSIFRSGELYLGLELNASPATSVKEIRRRGHQAFWWWNNIIRLWHFQSGSRRFRAVPLR